MKLFLLDMLVGAVAALAVLAVMFASRFSEIELDNALIWLISGLTFGLINAALVLIVQFNIDRMRPSASSSINLLLARSSVFMLILLTLIILQIVVPLWFIVWIFVFYLAVAVNILGMAVGGFYSFTISRRSSQRSGISP